MIYVVAGALAENSSTARYPVFPSSSLSRSSLIDPKSGLGALHERGRLALKLLARPLPLPVLVGVSCVVVRPRVVEIGIVIPNPVKSFSCLFPAREVRPSFVCLLVKSFKLSGMAKPKSE